MAVVGLVHPRQVLTNGGARPGDALVLTKPLGLGAVATALAQDVAPADAATEALRLMTTLNDTARDAALEVGVSAATDVTGFGLLGHLREMLVASGLAARLELNRIPVIPGVRDLVGVRLRPRRHPPEPRLRVADHRLGRPSRAPTSSSWPTPRPPAACSWPSSRPGPGPWWPP